MKRVVFVFFLLILADGSARLPQLAALERSFHADVGSRLSARDSQALAAECLDRLPASIPRGAAGSPVTAVVSEPWHQGRRLGLTGEIEPTWTLVRVTLEMHGIEIAGASSVFIFDSAEDRLVAYEHPEFPHEAFSQDPGPAVRPERRGRSGGGGRTASGPLGRLRPPRRASALVSRCELLRPSRLVRAQVEARRERIESRALDFALGTRRWPELEAPRVGFLLAADSGDGAGARFRGPVRRRGRTAGAVGGQPAGRATASLYPTRVPWSRWPAAGTRFDGATGRVRVSLAHGGQLGSNYPLEHGRVRLGGLAGNPGRQRQRIRRG
jgi:hypothetical protein